MSPFNQIIQLPIKPTGDTPIYNCILYINAPQQDFLYAGGTGQNGESGEPVSAHHRFRTGSITKPFTATIILQLMEEGRFTLEDRFLDLLKESNREFLAHILLLDGENLSHQITIEHLLRHRSGLRDYFSADDRFFEHVTNFPDQAWNWQSVMEKFMALNLNKKATSRPGSTYHYADTNYLLLALLIEESCQLPFHEVLEERILSSLELEETYLEFFQPPKGESLVAYPYYGTHALREVNTSFDWGGGGLISSMPDLDVFIRALLSGELFHKEATLQKILAFTEDESAPLSKRGKPAYSIGLQRKTIDGRHFFGHSSAYGSMLYYDPIADISIVLSLNQAAALHKAEWLLGKVIQEYNSL